MNATIEEDVTDLTTSYAEELEILFEGALDEGEIDYDELVSILKSFYEEIKELHNVQ